MKHLFKSEKMWTLKIQKSKIVILVLNQSPISAVFPIVQFPGDQKTALTGESLYVNKSTYLIHKKCLHENVCRCMVFIVKDLWYVLPLDFHFLHFLKFNPNTLWNFTLSQLSKGLPKIIDTN